MLEVKNLKKEYKTKNGAITKALDDVSLNFPERGMVFILGKSGSGKSTLLNVCGGLDRMDSGEIIIKGKSSKDFSVQDFDSYRNTYVGFVFQEYNILDEFTVEQNIALALELQNKKPDKNVINRILADVDITDFASRKPNTLSGGQKQRVAIARALVKEPEIIMADEPTGALDSKTGQQVFDTLKKLSENKLVIVISHDRDFAEQYGDRIIELKDGKIISDQTRVAEGDGIKNVRFYGTDTVCVSNGAQITDAELASIRDFLTKSGGTAVISTSREKIAQFKDDRPEISVGSFENIKQQPAPKQYEPQKLIRSHLPIKHAVKMGAGSLKTKPVRLVFTILLSVIAFILFGLTSTLMLFDEKEVKVQTFADSNINYISMGKIYYVTERFDNDSYTYDRDTKFTEQEYQKFVESYGDAIPMVRYNSGISNFSLSGFAQSFYSNSLSGLVPASDKLKILAGRLPASDDEVAITDFMFDAFSAQGSKFVYGESNTKLTLNSYEDVLYSTSKPVVAKLNEGEFKIVGVFKGSEVPADYKSMKQAADKNEQPSNIGFSSYTWDTERESGLYMTAAVTENIFRQASDDGDYTDYNYAYFKESADRASIRVKANMPDVNESDYSNIQFGRFSPYSGKTLKIYGLDGAQKESIGNGEAAISSYNLICYYYGVMRSFVGQFENSENENESTETYKNAYAEIAERMQAAAEAQYRAENPEPDVGDDYTYQQWTEGLNAARDNAAPMQILYNLVHYDDEPSREERANGISAIAQVFDELGITVSFVIYNNTTSDTPVNICAYYFEHADYSCYLGDDLYATFYNKRQDGNTVSESTKYEEPEGAYIDNILIPYDGSRALIEKLLGMSGAKQRDDSAVKIKNAVLEQLDTVVETADMLEMGFIIAGSVLALFAFLLMFNFISASITAKKKDIGILRAIGARTVDVFKIFVSEAFIIALICFAVSAIGTFGLCILLNNIILEEAGMSASLFVFGPLSVLCVFGIAFVTALIATVIPVGIYSRKPPITSIRAL